MKVAVDAMGGDHAPFEVVKGAISVAQEDSLTDILLVGIEHEIQSILHASGSVPPNIHIVGAPEIIGMGDHPAQAIRRKRNSSLVVAGDLVLRGAADATFSAGNTGAAMAVAMLDIGRIPGVDRPAIAATLPTRAGGVLLVDAGANVDCSPQNLLQFALLGSIYAERVLHLASPSVGLLNIGAEPGKGNDLTKATFELLSKCGLNFYGNVEGKGVFEHEVDVVVCDGFAGNILLKSGEGVAELILQILAQELVFEHGDRDHMLATLHKTLTRIDYADTGGAPLLGVNGVSVIGHGRSKARAIANGIKVARDGAASGYVQAIKTALSTEVGV